MSATPPPPPSQYDWINALHHDDIHLLIDALNRAVVEGRLEKFRLLRGPSDERIGLVCSADGCTFKAVLYYKTDGWRGIVVDANHTHPVAQPATQPTPSSTDDAASSTAADSSDLTSDATPSRQSTPTPSSTSRDEPKPEALNRSSTPKPSSAEAFISRTRCIRLWLALDLAIYQVANANADISLNGQRQTVDIKRGAA